MKNYKKIIILVVLFVAIAGFCLAPASAAKTSYYTVKIDNQKSFGKDIWENNAYKKVTLSRYNKKGINYYSYKTLYKKSKDVKYRIEYGSHGSIYDKNIITKVKVKYKKYNPKTGKYLKKYSYKTIKGKSYTSGGGNSVSYTSGKNWVPISSTVYIKNIKT